MTLSISNELQALRQQYARCTARDLPAGKPVWIFGAGQFGRDLCRALQNVGHSVAGFVETKPSASEVMGLPVLDWPQWAAAHAGAPVCVGIFNRGMPLDQLEAIARQAGAQDVFLPWDLYRTVKTQMDWRFWLSEPERILDQIDAFASALDCVDDTISQRCMLDIAAFRLGLNTAYGSFKHSENQYFNPLTLSDLQGKALRFVDGGAYNGDTYLELCGMTEVETAHLFEPDAANFAKLTRHVVQTPGAKRNACRWGWETPTASSASTRAAVREPPSQRPALRTSLWRLWTMFWPAIPWTSSNWMSRARSCRPCKERTSSFSVRGRCWRFLSTTVLRTCGSYRSHSPSFAKTTASMCASTTSTALTVCCMPCPGIDNPYPRSAL